MCYYVLKETGNVLSRTTVQHVTEDDYRQRETKARIENFNNAIVEVCSDQNHMDAGIEGNMHQLDNYDDESDEDIENVEPVDIKIFVKNENKTIHYQ